MAPKKNFALRLDPKLYEALERWAEDEFRSVNSHIEYVLREALHRTGRLPKPGPAQPVSDPDQQQ
ncbi:hypothetical protein GCM10008018_22750 [Paenibacillus marchantiophytorum]|uniref:Arc-like DNA binding domain-containing protein n=1 Tax=Paenibacillus marchantiophytorum TaxID=1619310 RepID=A0ABQ1EL26_9BACL|nr:Arc family DNA-binding protein [Paenibacillus marchantiophytorum]GFZ76746.1 hypothetical protein GCM10008018_22750 [Paenibacillus marchantiophytorum]